MFGSFLLYIIEQVPVAQRIEQQSSKLWVEGSIPSWDTKILQP